MSSFILKNNDQDKEILLYQEKKSYTFIPKKKYKMVKKITVLDEDMLSSIWQIKIEQEYKRLLKIVLSLFSSNDTTSGDVLIAYTEVKRIKEYIASLEKKGLKEEIMNEYLNKLNMLELEIKKIHVMELEEEINEERGKGR